MNTFVVVPFYNNDWAVKTLINHIKKIIPVRNIIAVNDGSTDRTGNELAGLPEIRVITHVKNMGKGAALESGFRTALLHGAEWIITMDGDGQHSPDDLPFFLTKNDSDLVLGQRKIAIGNMPFFRILSNTMTSWILSRITGQHIPDSQCGFRKINANVLRQVRIQSGHFQYESELLIRAAQKGFKINSIRIRTLYNSRWSSMRHFRDTLEFIRMILVSR